jgi:hypothetical protein
MTSLLTDLVSVECISETRFGKENFGKYHPRGSLGNGQ